MHSALGKAKGLLERLDLLFNAGQPANMPRFAVQKQTAGGGALRHFARRRPICLLLLFGRGGRSLLRRPNGLFRQLALNTTAAAGSLEEVSAAAAKVVPVNALSEGGGADKWPALEWAALPEQRAGCVSPPSGFRRRSCASCGESARTAARHPSFVSSAGLHLARSPELAFVPARCRRLGPKGEACAVRGGAVPSPGSVL